jgi:hypothetical protein
VTPPDDGLLGTGVAVQSLAVGQTVGRRPEIRVLITPEGPLNGTATVTLPMPFAMPEGTSVPFAQKKNGVWTEVGTATVNADGHSATATITELLPTGVVAWHKITGSKTQLPDVTLGEVSLASINNSIAQLPDRKYVVTKTIKEGQTANIAARFRGTMELTGIDSTEDLLIQGPVARRAARLDSLNSGPWNMAAGPVKYKVFQLTGTVERFVGGSSIGSTGTITVTRGVPNWPLPSTHNQGGVQ